MNTWKRTLTGLVLCGMMTGCASFGGFGERTTREPICPDYALEPPTDPKELAPEVGEDYRGLLGEAAVEYRQAYLKWSILKWCWDNEVEKQKASRE